ncbi:hypothetical protein ACFL0X_02500 [Nanoarchaeota archaeon]
MPKLATSHHPPPIISLGEVMIVDDFENRRSEVQYFLVEDGERLRVYFEEDPYLKSGVKLKIRGKVLKESVYTSEYDVLDDSESPKGSKSWEPNQGEQKVAFVLVKFSEDEEETFTEEDAYVMMDEVEDYYLENSYEQVWFNVSVYGYYVLDGYACDYSGVLHEVVEDSVIGENIDWLDVDRLIILWPEASCSSWAARGSVGIFYIETYDGGAVFSSSYIDGPPSTSFITAHELGHNFGVWHANYWNCVSEVLGDSCDSISYQDMFDIMGLSNRQGHLNSFHKEEIGWFDVLSVYRDGVYDIYPIEMDLDEVQALKINLLDGNSYYVEYRRAFGFDFYNFESEGADVYDGAMIRLTGFLEDTGDTHLIDNSPEGFEDRLYDISDVVLREGESFYDSVNDVAIVVREVNDNCGNGIVDGGEPCDGDDLDEMTCELLGYRGGELSCRGDCEFDVSGCEVEICGTHEEYPLVFNDDGSCTATFWSKEDAKVSVSSQNFVDWNEFRNRERGDFAGSEWPSSYDFMLKSNFGNEFEISRVSLPFESFVLPDDAVVNSASLKIRSCSISSSHPDSIDFMTVVGTTLENPPYLTEEDFDEIGFIDDPLEFSNRVDIFEDFNSERRTEFVINSEGLDYINNLDYTIFGLRAGYDLESEMPNNGESTRFYVCVYNGENYFRDFRPSLVVDYNVPGYSSLCVDSDEGLNYYEKGYAYLVTSPDEIEEDFCVFDNYMNVWKVNEKYCENDEIKSKNHLCFHGCDDGACSRTSQRVIVSANRTISIVFTGSDYLILDVEGTITRIEKGETKNVEGLSITVSDINEVDGKFEAELDIVEIESEPILPSGDSGQEDESVSQEAYEFEEEEDEYVQGSFEL